MVTNIILFLILMIILVTVIALIVNHFEQLSKERDTLEAERKGIYNQNIILQNILRTLNGDITELCYSMRTMEELCNFLFEMLRRSYDIQRIDEDVTTVLNIKYIVDSALEQRLEQCIDPENIQEIANAIRVIRDDPAKRTVLSRGALETAANLTIKQRAESIAKFMESKITELQK